MKTFETEKHNIPEGATHYLDETYDNFFYWGMRHDGRFKLMDTNSKEWLDVNSETFNLNCKPIPQAKEVEWVNGDDVEAYGRLYKYVGLDPFNDNLCICLANQDDDPQCFSIEVLSKPETEAERVERERDEFKVEICKDLEIEAVGCNTACIINKLYELGYRKGSE